MRRYHRVERCFEAVVVHPSYFVVVLAGYNLTVLKVPANRCVVSAGDGRAASSDRFRSASTQRSAVLGLGSGVHSDPVVDGRQRGDRPGCAGHREDDPAQAALRLRGRRR